MSKPKYSIILPIRNEDASLPQLFREIATAFSHTSHEVIAVDDASGYTDHPGKWEALRQGIARARGTYIITMDADLQDDPRQIEALISTMKSGFDIVSGWRKNRQDPWYKVTLTTLANRLYGFHDFASPMKLYHARALEVLPKQGSDLRYALLFARSRGMRFCEVPIVHRARKYGVSKFGMTKYARIFVDLALIFFRQRAAHLPWFRKGSQKEKK